MNHASRLIARVTVEIDVHLETDPGTDNPDACEPPYDCLVVRDAATISTETFGDTGPLAIVEHDGFDDHDPDDLIQPAIASALTDALHGQRKATLRNKRIAEAILGIPVRSDHAGDPIALGSRVVNVSAGGSPFRIGAVLAFTDVDGILVVDDLGGSDVLWAWDVLVTGSD